MESRADGDEDLWRRRRRRARQLDLISLAGEGSRAGRLVVGRRSDRGGRRRSLENRENRENREAVELGRHEVVEEDEEVKGRSGEVGEDEAEEEGEELAGDPLLRRVHKGSW